MKRPPIHITLDELSLPEGVDLDASDLEDRLRRALAARWHPRDARMPSDEPDDSAAAVTRNIADRVWQAIEAAAPSSGRPPSGRTARGTAGGRRGRR